MNLLKKHFRDYKKAGGTKELLILAFPMIISTACDGIMTFTDRFFLAKLGPELMNAAMGGAVTFQMLTFFFMGLTGYSTALVAQYFGAGERFNSTRAAFQAILITLLAWPVIVLAKPLAVSFYHLIELPTSQLNYQVEYLGILVWGGLFGMLRYTLGCYFTGIGKTKVVMVATLAAMLVNVVLDYILILGKLGLEPMGIRGAAYATISGAAVSVIILIVAYLSKVNRDLFGVIHSFRFSPVIMKKLLRFGYPAGLEFFLNFLAFFVMISLFHSQGDVVATATTIMFNWDLVSFIPLLGIEVAVTSLVGRYMGAGRPQVAHRAALSGIRTGVFYSGVILVLFLFVPQALVRIFEPATWDLIFEESVPLAISMIRIAALYVLVEAVIVALVGALRGAGDIFFTMVASVLAHWFFVPILWVSFNVFQVSVVTAWFLLVIFFLFFSLVFYLRFKSGKWKLIKVIDK